ncbi:hypothetical protein NDK50_08010 [Paraburkholderia bryophila]|uniref:hypothetical protein n=1 Tax=Paraburkholderia bryophila TaxID=420952 RepID=UPI0023499DB7|nr:hypothetical protein [Paraburkholderia bryophila]WCM21380.1 hypothetical protein NDK50_08010 [Paraburkholderia bryophila]
MTLEYRIKLLKDFLTVPPESIDACVADFKVWLELARKPDGLNKQMNDLLDAEGSLSFCDDSFVWLNDGLSGILHIEIVDGRDDSPIGRISLGESE